MGKMTADELRRAGEAYRSENNGAQKSPVTVSANTNGSSNKMTASELRQAGEAYRKENVLSDPIYMKSPASVVDKYSTPSTQPTQAAPAGASSRKQSDVMQEQVDALKKQRDDAAIKAGAYMLAGNMQQQAKEQQKIANKAAIEYANAYTKLKNQRNAEAVEDYNPDENKFKVGDAALSGVQNAFQSMGQYAAAASSYLSGNPEAQAWEAKRLMDSGVSGTEAVKRAGLADKREIPITDYKTQAELRHEKNVASVGAVEGGALQLVNTISNMVPSLVANAVIPGSGLPMMAASAAGNKYADAYEKYGNTDKAFVLGSAAGGASMLTEQFGGLYGSLGKSAAGQAVAKKLMEEAPGLYNLANSVGGKWLRDALSEGIEEGAEDVINYAIEKALTGDSDEMDNFGYDILLGALAGGVLGGGNAAARSIAYNRTGKALNASPEAVAQQVQEGLEKGAGTAPAIYAAEVQKNPSNQMVGRLYEANLTYDAESGLSKIQNDITQVSINEIKAMVSKADALAQAAQKLNVEATPQAVATAITDAQRTESIKTAEDSVGQAFAPTVDNPANAGEAAYNSAIQGAPANQSAAQKVYNDPAARQSFSQLTGVQFTGNTAQDIAAIEVATRNIAKSGKQAVSQAEYAQRVAAAGEQAAAQFDANMQAQADQMQRESEERWLSIEQNTITDVDGKRRIKEITNTDVRGNTEIGYKKAEITKSKKKAVDAVNNAAKYLGKTIVWYEGALQVNGQYRLANGFRAPDGTIYVNINSRDPLMVTFGHELFHDLVADSKYSGLIDTLVEDPDYADMVKGMMNAKTELYERNGIELDPNAAAEEVAADISGDLLGSRDMLEYIGARNTEAATGIKGFLNRTLKKLKGKPSAQEAYNRLSEAQKALLDGMEGRAESTNSAEDASGEHPIMDIANAKIVGDGDVDVVLLDGYEDIGVAITGEDSAAPNRYSLMSFGESELGTDRFKYATRLAKATGVSVQQATDWIDSVYSVAAIIGDDKVRLDYEANRNNTSLKPNSEYDFSLDFSTLCAKRLLFSGTMDAIQSALPNTPLTSEDFVHLREIMKDSGYEVACGICYVESTRREFSTISEGFIEQYRKAQAEGTNIKKVNSSGQTKDLTTSKGIENSDPNRFVYPEEGFTPTLADLVTAEGIDRLQAEHPEVYKAFNAYMNARGQQKPKMIETRTDYRGEILNMTKGQVSRRNSHGGLRIQSFSDFEVPHLIDMMQAVYDMASMGLKGQAYTKVPSFARAMGQTGIKINLSLIAKGDGVDANGKLIFDDVEGMPSSEAFAIRNDPRFSENVGTILVGKNVKHIVTAMDDPEIDFIIPFHKSSWSASLYKSLGLEGYEDFTDYQNEKKVGTKIENYDPSEYWDFSKSGDENAKIYLAKCKADGRTPKFAEVMYNGKSLTEYPGYWKLLIDFKMYNNDGLGAPQKAVKPVFDDEFNAKLLNEYNGGHRKLPVARDIVDRFLKEKSEGSYSLMDIQAMDSEYSAAVESGNMQEAQRLVDEAAKESGAILDANGRRPLHLYHGTNTFGYTKFRDGVIYATPNQSVAAGYGRTGYAKPRTVSDVYVPDDGTMGTLIKNAKNVLDLELHETTVNERQEARDAVKKEADSIAALVDKVWTSDAVDAMELTEEQANALSNVLSLPSYISEVIDDIGTYATVDEVAYWISRFNDGLPIIRSYINENRDSLKNSPAWDMARLILGYDLSDFAIDAEYRLLKSYEEDLLTNTNGSFVSADVVREEVEKAKDIGSYTLYGFAGDRPLVIDGGGAFWANVPVDVWGGTYTTDDIVKRAKDEGYTSVLIKNINDVAMNNYSANIKADIYAFFSPEQVKSADPVTYDDEGNVIPLSERFNPDNPDLRYSLMEDAQYMADIDKAVAEATAKSEEALKSAQAEVKELRQQLLDYRQQADAEAKMNERWRDAETKLVADLAAAKEREKAAKARAEFMAKYDALAKQYRADLRANNQQAQEKYNEKLTEAKDEFNRRRTQDRIDRVVREDQAKSKARLRAAEQKSTTTDDVAKVLTEMPKKDKETFKAKIAESWRTFKRQWINTKDELERFGNEVGDSRIMYAANNVGQASAAAQYSIGGAGQYDLNGKKIGDKNLMQVFEPAKKAGLIDEFYTYLLHEHNVDRMSVREKAQRQLAELREKLNREVKGFAEMTDENIATAAGKDTTLTKSYTEEQIAAAKQYKQFQAWAEKQFDKPVFGSSVTAADSRAAADKLLKEHPEFEKWAKDVYAYLDGLMEVRKQGGLVSEDMVQRMKELYPHYVPTYRDMPSTSGGYSNPNSVAVNSTIKAAKGGNQDIMPLIDSIARQTLQTFSAAKKNILGNMLYEDAMDTTRDISEYIQNVTEDGELVDLDADSAETLKNTLRIWVDGKPVTLHMSEAMADGFRPIEQSDSFGMKALRSINSTFKKLVTQWNPVFIVRNFVRDAQSALYFTHYSNATFIKNYGKAVKEIATNGKYWQLYQAMGGKGTTYYDPKTGLSDRHHFKNGEVDKVAGGLNRVIDILSFANEAVEQYPRLAEFISTMEATGDVQQALYNAADITTNFGRGGFAARKLNASLVPFFNPGMQGLSKNIRNVIDRRGAKEIGQLISRLLLNGVMPGIIMSLVYDGLKEDEDYKELSNYIKDSNILIKIGDDKFIKIPMGREPSVITAFTNRMWRWLKGEPASSAFADYPSFAIEQLAPNNPLTNNIFAGITAMSTNKNWYGGDIVSSYMEEKPDYLQYDESTDAFSIWLGEITRHGKNGIEGLSPKKVNYLIDQYSGFIGDWVLPALSKKADVPAVVKAFVVDSVRQNRLGSDFYDALDEAKQVKETEFATAADDATYSYLYKQSKAASEITKQLKEIYNSGEKTRKEKMSEARDLLELRNEIYRNALLTVGTYEETAKSIDSADSDVVKREANRKAFGAEYALKTYNKDVGEKAAEYVAQGVTYDQYYAAYFATRGITGDKDENGKTITNSASRKKKEAIDKAVPNATTKQKHLLYEAIGVSDKVW